MSLLNAVASMGAAVSDYAGQVGLHAQQNQAAMDLLDRKSQLEQLAADHADALLGVRESKGRAETFGYSTQLESQRADVAAKAAATAAQAQRDLEAYKSTLPTPDERLLQGLGVLPQRPSQGGAPAPSASPAAPGSAPAPSTGGAYIDNGTWDGGAAPPALAGPRATPAAASTTTDDGTTTTTPSTPAPASAGGITKAGIVAGVLHNKFGVPLPGSDAESRALMAEDLVNDAYWSTKTPGERAMELESRMAAIKGLERGGIYKFEAATAPDPSDPTGKATVPGFMRFNVKTGESEFIPTNTNPNKPGAAGGMGNRAELMYKRLAAATDMATAAAANIMEMPSGSSTGVMAGFEGGHSMMGALKSTLAQVLSPQEVQDYNVMASGLGRNLAAIETSGLAPPASFTKSMDSILLTAGDTGFTKLRKMAELRQIVTEGMKANMADPKIPDVQKSALKESLDKLATVIPFTHHDLNLLQYGKGVQTLTDVMKAKGLGGKPDDGSGGGGGGTSTPPPPPGFTIVQ